MSTLPAKIARKPRRKRRDVALVGPWGNREEGPQYVRPEGWAALGWFGKTLEAATGETAYEYFQKGLRGERQRPATVNVTATDLHALGKALRRVAAGEDARHVFGQAKVGHRQDDRPRKQTIAYLYWYTLAQALNDGASDRDAKAAAVDRARRQFSRPQIDAATVVRYATAQRAVLMPRLEFQARHHQGPKLDALRAYLAKHTRRGRLPD